MVLSHEVYSSLLPGTAWQDRYEATYSSAKHTNINQQPGSQFGHGMILDILEYVIKALLISYNELENGAVILIWHS